MTTSFFRGWCRPDDRTVTRPPPFARSPVQPGHPVSPVLRSVRSPGQAGKRNLTGQPDRPSDRTNRPADRTDRNGRTDELTGRTDRPDLTDRNGRTDRLTGTDLNERPGRPDRADRTRSTGRVDSR